MDPSSWLCSMRSHCSIHTSVASALAPSSRTLLEPWQPISIWQPIAMVCGRVPVESVPVVVGRGLSPFRTACAFDSLALRVGLCSGLRPAPAATMFEESEPDGFSEWDGEDSALDLNWSDADVDYLVVRRSPRPLLHRALRWTTRWRTRAPAREARRRLRLGRRHGLGRRQRCIRLGRLQRRHRLRRRPRPLLHRALRWTTRWRTRAPARGAAFRSLRRPLVEATGLSM